MLWLQPDGQITRASSFGGPNWEEGWAVTVDAAGRAYVAGQFAYSSTFGSTSLESAGYGLFVAALEPSSELTWVASGGGPLDATAVSVLAESTGNVLRRGPELGLRASDPPKLEAEECEGSAVVLHADHSRFVRFGISPSASTRRPLARSLALGVRFFALGPQRTCTSCSVFMPVATPNRGLEHAQGEMRFARCGCTAVRRPSLGLGFLLSARSSLSRGRQRSIDESHGSLAITPAPSVSSARAYHRELLKALQDWTNPARTCPSPIRCTRSILHSSYLRSLAYRRTA